MSHWCRNVLLSLIILAGLGCDDSTRAAPTDATAPDGSVGADARVDAGARLDAGGRVDAGPAPGTASSVVAVTAVEAGRVSTSPVCAECHSNAEAADAMRDRSDRPIAPFDLWQGSMKANATRDPLWRAVVSAEVYRNPAHAEAIEATCMGCHAPMAVEHARQAGVVPRLAHLAVADDRGQLGADGVSCTLCHGMTDANFGLPASFGGGWVLNDDRAMYGPHDDLFAQPMQMHTDFTPTQSDHILRSEQCATCHTLFTETIMPDGTVSAVGFPEQTPYLEWKNSRYSSGPDARTCQGCHMPTADADGQPIRTGIARNPMGRDFGRVDDRAPYGRHLFVGGNTLIPEILVAERDALKPLASDAAFAATIAATRTQLVERTASVRIEGVQAAERLAFNVVVQNNTGHKFPSAYPSRRAWLHVVVRGAADQVLFESGGWNDAGQIVVGEQPLASERVGGAVSPHHTTITGPDAVQIYQSFMGDTTGRPTVALLHSDRYLKDNRLLPFGFRMDHPDIESIRPRGVTDPDFVAGGDTVRYDLAVSGAVAIEVELVYQVLGARWAAELFEVPTADVIAFKGMYERARRTPEPVAEAAARVE